MSPTERALVCAILRFEDDHGRLPSFPADTAAVRAYISPWPAPTGTRHEVRLRPA
jgi:hypothetical protein